MQRITLDSEISYVVTEKELKEIRADERKRVIHEILTEYESAVKSDREASLHGDIFPKNVERFWQKMKEGDQK